VRFRELWRLSDKVLKEITFQSIFSLRAGSALPTRGTADIKRLVRNAEVNTLLSKILTAVFIGIFGFSVFLPFTSITRPTGPPKELALMGSASAFLASVLFLTVFMGLQVATSILSSKIADALTPLPMTKRDVSNIIFICFARTFDIPLATAAVVFLSGYFLVGGTLLGGFIALMAVLVAEAFALALTVGMARFFYSRVAGSGGRSRWRIVLRLAFMLVWVLPTLGAYLVINLASEIVVVFASFSQGLANLPLLTLIYPFSFGYLLSRATYLTAGNTLTLTASVFASSAYATLALYVLRWVTRTIREVGGKGLDAAKRETVKDTFIRPQTAWLGIIRKDLRIASRSPSYASLFLLPALQAVILAISFPTLELGFGAELGLLTGVSMMTLMLPPTMFLIEGLASTYTKSLPMTKRTVIFAKTALTALTYAVSMLALFVASQFVGGDLTDMLTFGAVHTLSIVAASMLELVLLARKFWKDGFGTGNLYSRLTTFVLIILPGLVLVWTPIAAALTAFFLDPTLVLPAFLASALTEFAIMTLVAYKQK